MGSAEDKIKRLEFIGSTFVLISFEYFILQDQEEKWNRFAPFVLSF